MGKEWDRLGADPNVGKFGKSGFDPLSGKPDRGSNQGGTWFGSRGGSAPNYYRSTNVKCRTCGKWKLSGGHDGKGNTLGCKCAVPDFANPQAEASRQSGIWHERWLHEAYRVLAPGGTIKAFGGSRTFHRLAAAMEAVGFVDVGLEAWGYGSGFPKSLDVSKAIDKSKGLERKVIGSKRGVRGADGTGHENAMPGKAVGVKQVACEVPVTAPASPEAEAWSGWGTALKPAWEPVLVARKPR